MQLPLLFSIQLPALTQYGSEIPFLHVFKPQGNTSSHVLLCVLAMKRSEHLKARKTCRCVTASVRDRCKRIVAAEPAAAKKTTECVWPLLSVFSGENFKTCAPQCVADMPLLVYFCLPFHSPRVWEVFALVALLC